MESSAPFLPYTLWTFRAEAYQHILSWLQVSSDMVTVVAWLLLPIVIIFIVRVQPSIRGDRLWLYIYLAYAAFVFTGAAEKFLDDIVLTLWPLFPWREEQNTIAKGVNALVAVCAIGLIISSLSRGLKERETQLAAALAYRQREAQRNAALAQSIADLEKRLPRGQVDIALTEQVVKEIDEITERMKAKLQE